MDNQDIPREISEFETALNEYVALTESLATNYSIQMESRKESKKLASILYQKGANFATLMESLVILEATRKFRSILKDIYNVADNSLIDSYTRTQLLDDLKKVFWDARPIIIRDYLLRKQNTVKLNLNDNVDLNAKEYLIESKNALNAGAPRASVVMAGAALEKILRKRYDNKFGKSSEGIKLYVIMESFENSDAFKNENEKVTLQICKSFRNFSAHPSNLVVNMDLAKLIFQSVESLVNFDSDKK